MYAEGKLHGEVGGVVEPGRPLSKLDGENFEELECHVRNGARTLTCCCSSRLFEARSDRKRICCGMYIPSQVKPLLTPSGFARQVYDLFLDA